MRTQCKILSISRSILNYKPVQQSAEDTQAKRILDELYLRDPCLGSRRLVTVLERDHGLVVNRKRIQRLRNEMGIEAIYCKPRTTIVDKANRIYPYLLRELAITLADQVWCTDITYVPMPQGNAYLCAVMDWHTRCVLGWAVSNTMDVSLCLLALERTKAFADCVPEIFNMRSSIRIKAASLPARNGHPDSKAGEFRSAWTTCSSNGFGGASNTRRFIFASTPR